MLFHSTVLLLLLQDLDLQIILHKKKDHGFLNFSFSVTMSFMFFGPDIHHHPVNSSGQNLQNFSWIAFFCLELMDLPKDCEGFSKLKKA